MALDAYTALLLCRTDRCRLFEGHVEQRIRISLFVVIRSFADLKSHVFVKFPCLWILFVYCQFSDGIPFDAVSEQIFPDALPLSSGATKSISSLAPSTPMKAIGFPVSSSAISK